MVASLTKSKVFVERVVGDDWSAVITEALRFLDFESAVRQAKFFFIKPNLTWKTHLPGVTTRPELIADVVGALNEYGRPILIGESDGGYHSHTADQAFEGHGLLDLADRFGVKLVNLSRTTPVTKRLEIAGKTVEIVLPEFLLQDDCFFVTLPVPKIHVMTRVSLAMKNQWGCIPDVMRLRNHPEFSHKITAINLLLNPRCVIMDGKYFLNLSGPLGGDPVQKDLIIASNQVGAASYVACAIMRVPPFKAPHHRVAAEAGLFPADLSEVELNQSIEQFADLRFTLQRSLVNWVARSAFSNHLATKWLYESNTAERLRRFVKVLNRNRLLSRLLYRRWQPIRPTESDTRIDSS